MSKEATGWSGTILGSSDYWEKLNHDTLFSDVTTQRPDYRMALTRLGHRASDAIDAIYGDLNELAGKIRFLPSEDRNALAKQVQSLYDVCRMGGVSAHRADDCIQGLSLSFMSPWSRDIPDPRAEEKAIEAIKLSPFSTRDRVALLLEAGHWGVNSAAGRDEKTRLLLQAIADLDHSSNFLTSVAEEYQQQTDPPRHEGRCGYEVGSRAYREHFEEQVFGRTLSGMFGTADYTALLREDLNSIARQLERDLDDARREGDYITDGTADILRDVVDDLDHCGASTMGLTGKIDKLAWYVGGDPAKIRRFQRALNSLDPSLHLEEDGVYGKETQHAWLQFLRELENGSVPTLCWTDLLQEAHTGIKIRGTTNGEKFGLTNSFVLPNGHRYIRFDPPDSGGKKLVRGVKQTIDYNHINLDDVADSNYLYDWLHSRYNHYPLSDSAYKVLSDLDSTTKKIRIGGKILLVAGAALDALELGLAIDSDLKDADKKLGKTTMSTVASIGGSWAAAALLAKAGALAGAATGPAAPFAIPILSLLGGVIGSIGGSRLAEYIVDITYIEE